MASSTPFRPVTTIQEPGLLGMPRTYTSQREVAAETGAPARGSVLGNVLGTQFATHIVLDASIQPKDGKRILVVSHCSAPAWAILLGSDDRQEGRGEHLYSQQVVPTPSQATIDADHLSTYQPIDESKTLKRTKIPRKKKTDGTYESGYPKQQVKSIGVDDLTPQKFKIQTTIVETSTTETLAAADVNNIPTPATPTGDQAKIVHQKLNDDQYKKTVTEEIIVENASPLLGEEYGDLVTKTTSELLVPDDTLADTGLAVLSSTVEPIGNGKSVKTTKTVKGGAWPDPVEQEIVSDATKQPPARYLRDLIRTTVKKMVSAVGSSTLTGNQVAKSYKRETPDRVAETVTTEELNLTLTAIDSGVQQKPFVTITEVMTPGPAKVLPTNRSGSAKLVYEQGTNQIWENTEEVAVAREGPAGSDKEAKPFVSIQTDKRYATDPTINTTSGSANLIFNDGTVQAYEVSEVTATAKLGAAGTATDQKPFVTLQTVKTYEATDNLGAGEVGSTNKIYDDGTTEVYEKSVVNATAREGLKGVETSAQQWGAIKSTTNYTADSTAPAGGSVQIVFAQGTTTVYEQTTTDPTVSGSSTDVDPQQWGKITWNGSYSSSSSGDKSRQVWSNGVDSVFLNETASLSISGGSTDVDPQQWGKITWNGNYSSSSSGDKSRQVYSGPGGSVFLNEIASVAPSGGTLEKDSAAWGSVTWNGSYSSSSSGDKSRQVYSGPGGNVYLNEIASVAPSGGTLEKDSAAWGSVTWNGNYSGSPSGDRYKQVANIGGNSVYLNETASVAPSGGSKEVDPNAWGSITWNGTFSSASGGTRSQKVAQVGPTSVYKNETPVLSVAGGSFTSAQEKHPLYTTVETSSFATTSILGQGDSRSKQVFALGAERVFENISRVVTSTGTRTYGTMVKFTAPSVLLSMKRTDLMRRDGGIDAIWNPVIEEGFEGFLPAQVTEKYSDNGGFSGGSVINFGPTPIKIATPFGNVSIGPTLHGAINLVWSLSNDRTYYNNSDQILIPATRYATWRGVGRVLVGYETQPHLSGFITREIHITL
jgi:hypothetical protein